MAMPHQLGQLRLAQRSVHRHPLPQPTGQVQTPLTFLPETGPDQMQVRIIGIKAGAHPQQPVDTLGVAQFAGVEQLHRPLPRFLAEREEAIVKAGTDDIDPLRINPVQADDLVRLSDTQGEDTIDFPALRKDFGPQMRAFDKLPQIRRMAGGYHGQIRECPPGNGTDQPEMMTVNHVDGKRVRHLADSLREYPFIPLYLCRRQLAEARTGIRHDIAHPGDVELKITAIKGNEAATEAVDSVENRIDPRGDAGDQEIAVIGGNGLAQQVLQVDAAAGACRVLTDDMEDIHERSRREDGATDNTARAVLSQYLYPVHNGPTSL